MNINNLHQELISKPNSEKMPVLFIGHGSPMNAIEKNKYSDEWKNIGNKLAPPTAILCISAHWLTSGTAVCMASKPETIHDFGGFPEILFQQQYPAPGAPDLAKETIAAVHTTNIKEDFEWGLDHGAWSVLMNMFPKANVPVYQMSIDYTKDMTYHFNLAKELQVLRNKGVLIIGSGNVVHNLRQLNWNANAKPFDWALEFDELVKNNIINDTSTNLVNYEKLGALAKIAHPSNEHYIPLIYTLGLRDKHDSLSFFNDSFDLGSISMRSVLFS